MYGLATTVEFLERNQLTRKLKRGIIHVNPLIIKSIKQHKESAKRMSMGDILNMHARGCASHQYMFT